VRDERNDRRAPENRQQKRNGRTVGALQTPRQNRGSDQVTGKDEHKLGGEKPAFPERGRVEATSGFADQVPASTKRVVEKLRQE
jgi:hypothetical protein